MGRATVDVSGTRRTAIGRIGGGRRKPTGRLDVAVIQSLVRKGVVDDRVGEYGHLIVDECHHLSAHSFEQVARRAKARFVTGAVGHGHAQGRSSSDHLHAVRPGPLSGQREGAGGGPALHTPVVVRPTAFRVNAAARSRTNAVEFQALYEELIGDDGAQSADLRGCAGGRPRRAGRRSC